MQNIEIYPSRDNAAPSLITVLIRVTRAAAIDWRKFKPRDGASLEEMQRDAVRMALKRWPGKTQFQLMLPIGDCGAPGDV
jgi:hypothetical protein